MGSSGHYGDDNVADFTEENVMAGFTKSAGVGDESLPDSWGAYRVAVTLNTAHSHLPGDFIKRDKEGEMILMSREDYLRLVERIKKAETGE
jgi:hypothetical protein